MVCRVSGRGFALLLAGCGGATPHAAATMPGPAPQLAGRDAAERNAECVACHDEVAAEWMGSLHREAFTSREFQHALRSEPLPFCRGCHAPEADPRQAPPAALAEIGVACVTCHVPAGEAVLSARGGGASEAPHAVLRAPAFATAAACAGCHEFAFPDRRPAPEYMQTTVHEHATSAQAGRSCADCHMPRAADGHRSHAFLASRDEAWMRSVVTVQARRPAADTVELSLDVDRAAVGHALPTGDLLRRLRVQAGAPGATPQRRYLARHWVLERLGGGPHVRTEASDDRLGVDAGPRVVRFTLRPEEVGQPVRWSVHYERVEGFVGPGEDGAVVVGGMLLAEGTLAGA